MIYKASLDNLAKIITSLCCLLFIYIGYKTFVSDSPDLRGINFYLARFGIVFFLVIVLVVCYMLSTKSYKIDTDRITIVRPFRSFSVKFDTITNVELLSPSQLSGLIRTFGVGGLFGYYGKYYNSTLGSLNLYTTQRKNRIMIVTKAKVAFVISPDDPTLYQKLISAINEVR
jgi:hypothetical protein